MAGQVVVREATREDRKALFEWRNDQHLNSVYPSKGFTAYRDHCRWFDRLLGDPDRFLLVGVLETLRIGGVRFDRHSEDAFKVYLFVKPLYCGKGYGLSLLSEALVFLNQIENPRKVFARVKMMNPATRRIFEGAKFTIVEEDGADLHFEWTP